MSDLPKLLGAALGATSVSVPLWGDLDKEGCSRILAALRLVLGPGFDIEVTYQPPLLLISKEPRRAPYDG